MEDSEGIIEFYDNFAESYDAKVLQERDYTAFKIIPGWVLSEIHEANPLRILDLGCGTGLGSLGFMEGGHLVTGIDISPKMLEQAQKHPFEKLICQSLESPFPFEDQTFDAAIMLGVMEFIQDPQRLFREVRRVLRPKGLFGMTVPKKLSKDAEQEIGILTFETTLVEKTIGQSGFAILKDRDFQGFISKGRTVDYRGYLLQSKST